MMEKKRWLLVTFHTTAGAMELEKRCKEAALPGRLIPVPRSITADCGMAWRAEVTMREKLEQLTAELDTADIYELVI